MEYQISAVLAARQLPDLRFANPPIFQPRQAGLGELLHAALRLVIGILQRCHALHCQGIFALRRYQFRAVHLEQRLPLADCLPGSVDVEPLHPALELRRDGIGAPLVDLDAPRCT